MYTFAIQLLDLVYLNQIGAFFAFYILTWLVLGVKLNRTSKYKSIDKIKGKTPSVTVIIPVVDEPDAVWRKVLTAIKIAVKDLDSETFVVCNGDNCVHESAIAKEMGFTVLKIQEADKRLAIAEGVRHATKDITILLDSDTIATPNSIKELIKSFVDPTVGGVVPKQEVFNRESNLMRRLCDWFEDVRFNNTTKGMSYYNAVPCLIGRLFAIRTDALRRYIPDFCNEYFLGVRAVTGDDRVLTSMLLQDGYKTLYDDKALVYTDSPETLGKFIKQRTRWSRSSFRETLRALPWIFKHPYTAFVLLSDIVLRWLLFYVYVRFVGTLIGVIHADHWIASAYPLLDTILVWLVAGFIGFIISGYLKQIPHLRRYPQDFKYVPAFLFITAFVLTPVEWYGNITFNSRSWLTRKLN